MWFLAKVFVLTTKSCTDTISFATTKRGFVMIIVVLVKSRILGDFRRP